MVRSKWMKALVLALASTGLVRGQTTSSPYAAGAGKPTKPAAVAPAPATTKPTASGESRLTPVASEAGKANEAVITVQEAGKPAQRCKVLKTWKMADGSIASQVQALDTGETMTIVEDGKGSASGPGSGVRDVASRIFHWGRGTPPAGTPMAPEASVVVVDEKPTVGERIKGALGLQKPERTQMVECTDCKPTPEPKAVAGAATPLPVVVSGQPPRVWPPAHTSAPAEKVATRQQLADVPAFKGQTDPSVRRVEMPPPPPLPVVTSPKPVPPPTPQVVQIETKPSKPGDWRQSWGKPEVAPKKEESKPVVHVEPPKQPMKVEPPKQPMKVELPVADKNKVDPLKTPTAYNRHTMDDKTLHRPAAPVSPSTPPMLPPAPPVRTQVATGNVPLGAQSVIQSGTTNYVPVPVVTLPDTRHSPMGPTGRPPMPPSPNSRVMLNSFTAAPTPPAPVDTPADMANAFTPPQQTPMPEAVAAAGAFGQGQSVPAAALPYPPAYHPTMMARGMMPPQGYYPQMPPPGYAAVGQPGYAVAMAQRPPVAEEMMLTGPTSPAQLLGVLKESMYPSQREWAASRLAEYNGHVQPTVVEGLARAAKEDPAAIVRAACVRSLARMGVASQQVMAALQACRGDVDPRVQQEAEMALGGQPSQPILQAGEKPH